MGDGAGRAVGVATLGDDPEPLDGETEERDEEVGPPEGQAVADNGRRRFTTAAVIATAVVAVPYLWILFVLWGTPSLIRNTVYEDNFYDLQARAMFHGHLWLANGSIGIEAFVHGGHQYTYFGIFPSLIRMPILLVTHSLDGRLTAPFLLLAWLVTALFVSLLLWRVRVVIRGDVALGRLEATAFGVLIATILGGTVLMYLAATPYVFNEDLAWSVCLTVGAVFALLGVIEHASWARVTFSFAMVLAANLDRATTGWACVVAAVLIGVWFGLGRWGRENRRWFAPMLGVGLVPLAISCAINYSKFGVLFGVSNYEQVWTHVNAYRRKFLAANHNAEEGTIFVPSNLLAYLRPDGVGVSPYFPFITLPSSPATALSGVLFDRRYRTASLPSSTPLLFLLSLWGLVTAFRPHPIGRVALTRILLLSAGAAGAALLLWGYIAPRYLADFVPFLVLASAVAMVDIWRRLSGRSRSTRRVVLGVISLLALYSIAANIGMAITPNEEWTTAQVLHFTQAEKTFSLQSLGDQVHRGTTLPAWAPANELFVVGDCAGLYVSNGEDYSTVPTEQFQETTWMAVQRGPEFEHRFQMTASATGRTESLPLVTVGSRTVAVTATSTLHAGVVHVIFSYAGAGSRASSHSFPVAAGSTHPVVVVTDPAKHAIEVYLDGTEVFQRTVVVPSPIYAAPGRTATAGSPASLELVNETARLVHPTLCRSLVNP